MRKQTFSRRRKGKKTDPYPIGGEPKGAKSSRTSRTASGRPRAPVDYDEFPHEDLNRPPTRRPSSMGKHAYKRLLRRWRPDWSKVPLLEFAPHVIELVDSDFGEGRDIELWTLDEKSWNFYYKRVKNRPNIAAQAGDWNLKLNPKFLDELSGKDTSTEEGYKAHVVVTHEILHTRSKKYSDLAPPLEEGLTEYHANRLVSESLGAPERTRGHIKNDLPILYSAYPTELKVVQRIALQVSGGDKKKARAWLKEVYLAPGRSRFFREEMERAGMDERDIESLTTAKSGFDTKFQNAASRISGETKANLLKPKVPRKEKRKRRRERRKAKNV